MKINVAQFVCVRGKTCKIKGFFFKNLFYLRPEFELKLVQIWIPI